MDTKDWIQLLVPIIANGFLLFIVQKLLSKKIDSGEKRQTLRDSIVLDFWNKIQLFRSLLADAARSGADNVESLFTYLEKSGQIWQEIDLYYNMNVYDLKIVEKEYYSFRDSWVQFVNLYNGVFHTSNSQTNISKEQSKELGLSVSRVSDAANMLADAIRKKY